MERIPISTDIGLTWSEHALEMFSDVPDEELTQKVVPVNGGEPNLVLLPHSPILLVEQWSLAMLWTWYLATLFLFVKDPVNIIFYFLSLASRLWQPVGDCVLAEP